MSKLTEFLMKLLLSQSSYVISWRRKSLFWFTSSLTQQQDIKRAVALCMTYSNNLDIQSCCRNGDVASIVIIAEVVGIIVESQITKTTAEGTTGIDTAKLKPVSTFLLLRLTT